MQECYRQWLPQFLLSRAILLCWRTSTLEYFGIFNKTEKPPFFGNPKNGGFSKFLEIHFFGCRATLFDPKIKFVHHEFQYVRLVGACIVMMYMRTDQVYQCMHQPLVHPLARCIHVVAGISVRDILYMSSHDVRTLLRISMIDDHDAALIGTHHQHVHPPAQLFMCGIA